MTSITSKPKALANEPAQAFADRTLTQPSAPAVLSPAATKTLTIA